MVIYFLEITPDPVLITPPPAPPTPPPPPTPPSPPPLISCFYLSPTLTLVTFDPT